MPQVRDRGSLQNVAHLPPAAQNGDADDAFCDEAIFPLANSLDVSASVLSLHVDGDGFGRVLGRTGTTEDDEALTGSLLDHAEAMTDQNGSDRGRVIDRAWLGESGPDGRPVLSVVFRSARARSRIVFSAVFHRSGPPDRKMVAATLRRLMPMLDAYFRLWQRSRHDARQNKGLAGALDAVDLGVVLVDRNGGRCFANAAAEALLKEGRFLKQRGAAIHAHSLRETMRLQAALSAAIAENATAGGRGDAVTVQDSTLFKLGEGGDHLIVAALPMRQPADDAGAVAAMLIMLKPDGEPEKIAIPACKMFGLSAVETRLACQLVAGRSIAEASDLMRIKEATSRGYLKQIFAKVNVNRQADLVRVLLSSIVRARTSGMIQII